MAKLFLGTKESSPVVKTTVVENKKKFGLTIDNFLGDADENGDYIESGGNFDFVGEGIKIIKNKFNRTFYNNNGIRKFIMPDLVEAHSCFSELLKNTNAIEFSLPKCVILTTSGEILNSSTKLQTVNLENVEYLGGTCYCMFYGSNNQLTNTGLKKVKVLGYGNQPTTQTGWRMYQGNKNITKTGLESIEEIQGSVQSMFNGCVGLTKEYFPFLTKFSGNIALGTNGSFMFQGCTNLTEIHFRTDVQAIIETMTGYSERFGAVNATIYFDL